MDRIEEEGKIKERRPTEINEKLEKSRNKAGTVKQTMWSVHCFQTWCAKKDLTIDFKTISKMELKQALCHFYATVKNFKCMLYTLNVADKIHCLEE